MINPLIKHKKFEKAVQIARKNLESLGEAGKFLSAVVHDLATQPEEALQMLNRLAKYDPKNITLDENIIARIKR